MYSPVERLLTVLNLLQARPSITATELAERLEVNTRSVRRYVTMLQDIGIPIEAERGRYGGYRLSPGFKLPPLMWTAEEAVAVTLGLRAAEALGLGSSLPGVASALAKVERVLPIDIKEHVQAVQDVVVLHVDMEAPTVQRSGSWVSMLSMAAYKGQRSRIQYQAKDGEQTDRELDCYGVLCLNGQWYAIGYCHLRQDIRMFRLDRILHVELCEAYFAHPHNFDALAYTLQAIAAIPSRWLAEVVLDSTLEQVYRSVPSTFATLEERADGLLLRAYDDDLDHLARFLVSLGCPFLVLQPPELLDALQRLSEKLTEVVVQSQQHQNRLPHS